MHVPRNCCHVSSENVSTCTITPCANYQGNWWPVRSSERRRIHIPSLRPRELCPIVHLASRAPRLLSLCMFEQLIPSHSSSAFCKSGARRVCPGAEASKLRKRHISVKARRTLFTLILPSLSLLKVRRKSVPLYPRNKNHHLEYQSYRSPFLPPSHMKAPNSTSQLSPAHPAMLGHTSRPAHCAFGRTTRQLTVIIRQG